MRKPISEGFTNPQQVLIEVSGAVTLSIVKGLSGPDSYEVALIINQRIEDVVACTWADTYSVVDACRSGVFTHFEGFHRYLKGEG